MTIVLVMKIQVAPEREAEFERVVAERASAHRQTPGFERIYLLREQGGGEYRLVSWWGQIENPESFVRTETYALSEDAKHPGLILGTIAHEVLEIAHRVDPLPVAGNA